MLSLPSGLSGSGLLLRAEHLERRLEPETPWTSLVYMEAGAG